MRYYIKRDDDTNKPVAVIRFNSDEWTDENKNKVGLEEQFYNFKTKQWEDTDAVSTNIIFGGHNIKECSLAEAKRIFPAAFK